MKNTPAEGIAQRTFALVVEYDGSAFSGFQFQPDRRTVQAELERALHQILGQAIRVHCSGRTDAGVHAAAQVVSFRIGPQCPRPPAGEFEFLRSLNGVLGNDLAVHVAEEVNHGFHARFTCVAREYFYYILNSAHPSVHWRDRSYHVRAPLNVERINAELGDITGTRDFAALTRVAYKDETTVRYLELAALEELSGLTLPRGACMLRLRVRANGFLHNMIRILVGTLVDQERGKITESLGAIVQSLDRTRAGTTAPPQGLYFRAAYYPAELGYARLPTLSNYPRFGSQKNRT